MQWHDLTLAILAWRIRSYENRVCTAVMAAQTLFSYTQTDLLIDNHMYGGLADPEFPGSAPDSGPVFYDVKSQVLGPVLYIPFHTIHSPTCGASSLCGGGRGYECWRHRRRME